MEGKILRGGVAKNEKARTIHFERGGKLASYVLQVRAREAGHATRSACLTCNEA